MTLPREVGNPDRDFPRRRLGTVHEAAVALALPLSTTYELVRQKRLPGVVRVGRRIRIDLEKLDRWIERGCEAATGEDQPAQNLSEGGEGSRG